MLAAETEEEWSSRQGIEVRAVSRKDLASCYILESQFCMQLLRKQMVNMRSQSA